MNEPMPFEEMNIRILWGFPTWDVGPDKTPDQNMDLIARDERGERFALIFFRTKVKDPNPRELAHQVRSEFGQPLELAGQLGDLIRKALQDCTAAKWAFTKEVCTCGLTFSSKEAYDQHLEHHMISKAKTGEDK